jgi:SPP1 gp7 family putative phage head morphogenesis protein
MIQHEFEKFLLDHATQTVEKGLEHASNPLRTRLARPYNRRSLRELQKLYDISRRGLLPTRIQILAKKLKKDYIQKCQSVWDKYSKDFREGKVADQKLAVKIITKASDGVEARGKMIVETETTRYYNMARRSYFDSSPEVTHYLFLAIMDVATTSWCKTRHRVVYAKGDQVTDLETPPCHWNCRSEMVPLAPLNPVHKKLIDNRAAWRENRRPEPLPRGWNK